MCSVKGSDILGGDVELLVICYQFPPLKRYFFQQEMMQWCPVCLLLPAGSKWSLWLCVWEKRWQAWKPQIRSQQISLWDSEAELGNDMQMSSRRRRKNCRKDEVWIWCLHAGSRLGRQFVLWPDIICLSCFFCFSYLERQARPSMSSTSREVN